MCVRFWGRWEVGKNNYSTFESEPHNSKSQRDVTTRTCRANADRSEHEGWREAAVVVLVARAATEGDVFGGGGDAMHEATPSVATLHHRQEVRLARNTCTYHSQMVVFVH